MVNELLVNLVNSVLGEGKTKSRGNMSYICPFHQQEVISEKLEINFDQNSPNYQHWACWSCPSTNKSKGKSILSLFKKKKANQHYMDALKKIIPYKSISINTSESTNKIVELPKEFKTFEFNNNSIIERRFLTYLKNRGLTKEDIIKHNIGYCFNGTYSDRIIVPSYDTNGQLNFFTGRSINENSGLKYKNSPTPKDVIMFELFINWSSPLILCEGVFDAIAIKRNAIPVMGKTLQESLRKKLLSNKVKKIYLALDKDAIINSIEYCSELMNEGKKVYLIDVGKKDPSQLGFEGFTKLLHEATPLTEYSLMELKLQMV